MNLTTLLSVALLGLPLFCGNGVVQGFAPTALPLAGSSIFRSPLSTTKLSLSSSNDNGGDRFSREVRLREEAESPFRKVRFFLYASIGGGAMTSLVLSLARIAAGLSGINEDLLPESLVNAGVDLAGIVVLAVLYQRDLAAQESRLKRATKGAELAKLMVRGSKAMITGEEMLESTNSNSKTFTTSLASLRRGRGIEKRVVIAAAGSEKIDQVIQQAKELEESLTFSDLLVVPVVLPGGLAPEVNLEEALPACVALPVGLNWKTIVSEEADEANSQGVNVREEGMCIILKKNGRVGQRTKGINLYNMVGEVQDRAAMGMDVKNI